MEKILTEIITEKDIASKIDHTILKPEVTAVEIQQLCNEAMEHGFAAVCVPPMYVNEAKNFLAKSKVKVATVVGFPLGYTNTLIKVSEAKKAIDDGATEIDMVMNISEMKNKQYKEVLDDIQSVTLMAHFHKTIVKVILETCLLTNEEIVRACELCEEAGVDFVKTSTGFSKTGATVEAVKLIRESLPKKIKVKASGGIRTKEFALQLIEAGADRLGTSSGISIIKE